MGCDKIKILEKKFLFFMLLVGITFILSISQNTSSFVSYSTVQSNLMDMIITTTLCGNMKKILL